MYDIEDYREEQYQDYQSTLESAKAEPITAKDELDIYLNENSHRILCEMNLKEDDFSMVCEIIKLAYFKGSSDSLKRLCK